MVPPPIHVMRTVDPVEVHRALVDVFQLYCARSSASQTAIYQSRYAADATFEDPLMTVDGEANVQTQFRSLSRLFDSVSITWPSPLGGLVVTGPEGSQHTQAAPGPSTSYTPTPTPTTTVTGANVDDLWLEGRHVAVKPASIPDIVDQAGNVTAADAVEVWVPNTQRYAVAGRFKHGTGWLLRHMLPEQQPQSTPAAPPVHRQQRPDVPGGDSEVITLQVTTVLTAVPEPGGRLRVVRHHDKWAIRGPFSWEAYRRHCKSYAGLGSSAFLRLVGV